MKKFNFALLTILFAQAMFFSAAEDTKTVEIQSILSCKDCK